MFTAKLRKDQCVLVPTDIVKTLGLSPGDSLNLEVVPEGGVKGYKQIQVDLDHAKEYEIAVNTIKHYLPLWLANFKKNLSMFVEGARSFTDILPAEGEKRKCVVVANGPSLYEADLSPLKDFKGTIIAANKSLKPLLEGGIVPDWVTVLDAEEVVLGSFDHEIVRGNASHMRGIILPTTSDHKVAEFAYEHFGKERTFWSNPHFSDDVAPNVCETLTNITNVPSCNHGGNVGTYSYLMSIKPMLCNPIGLFGFDLSYRPDPKWTIERASLYRYYYLPQKNEFYAMTPPFEYYIGHLLDLWEMAGKRYTRTVNLTPHGPLNAVAGLPSVPLRDFCEAGGSEIRPRRV